MTTEVKVPALPESVSDGVVVVWHKQPGDVIERDEALVDIETDKVVLEVPAPVDGESDRGLYATPSTYDGIALVESANEARERDLDEFRAQIESSRPEEDPPRR